jgi:hypothetical protein
MAKFAIIEWGTQYFAIAAARHRIGLFSARLRNDLSDSS